MILTLALGLASSSGLAAGPDDRQVLSVTGAQRAHVLEEMRAMLSGLQAILGALSKDDMAAVAQHARPLGMAMAGKAEDHLKGVLPVEFMQMGMAVHGDFDQIAADAESLKDPGHTLRQLSDTLGKCVTCHAAYQVRSPGEGPGPGSPAGHHSH